MGTSVRFVGDTSQSVPKLLLKIGFLALLDAGAIWVSYNMFLEGDQTSLFIGVAVLLLTVFINIVFWFDRFYPFRWFTPGISLLVLLVVYPVLFTLYAAFTNYGTGNLLTKPQALRQILRETYTPEGGITFGWTAFKAQDPTAAETDYLIWFQTPETDDFLASRTAVVTLEEVNAGPLDENGVPTEIPGFTRLERRDLLREINALTSGSFGTETQGASILNLNAAAPRLPRYTYDPQTDTITDQSTGVVYTSQRGTFTAEDGSIIRPGYYVIIGVDNFVRLLTNPRLRGPFLQIFVWTITFAASTVFTTFALGLFLALIFNDPSMPGRKLIRSVLLVPYAIPAFITVQIWVGLLNPELGVVSQFIKDLLNPIFGIINPIFGTNFSGRISWFSDPTWAKIGIILVNLWLGFPYMMLICTGTLQTIPEDLYQAAEVDGASILQKFWNITLPLLLVSVGPLLIGSFAFNFNNFTVIDVFNQGGPPIANSPTPAGHTDILISYTYRVAFAGGRGTDYGYASAITIIIFIMLATMTALQFRLTGQWEEVSENV